MEKTEFFKACELNELFKLWSNKKEWEAKYGNASLQSVIEILELSPKSQAPAKSWSGIHGNRMAISHAVCRKSNAELATPHKTATTVLVKKDGTTSKKVVRIKKPALTSEVKAGAPKKVLVFTKTPVGVIVTTKIVKPILVTTR